MSKYGLKRNEYAFKVARIEPENKIDVILEAFSKMPLQKLVLVGNWNKKFCMGVILENIMKNSLI